MSSHKREPIVFENREGLKLFGIMHYSGNSKPLNDIVIILLSPGVKMRVGPHLLYNKMTERFLDMGFSVFRFDFYGLGDSEGDLAESLLADVYNHIEVGRYVNDTIDSMDYLKNKIQAKKFILSGLCGGAITGLLAASRDSRVAGLLGLGITAILASSAADPRRYMTKGQLNKMRKGYLRKIFKPDAWFRFLTFKSDYKIMWKSIMQPLLRKILKQNIKKNNTKEHEIDNSNPLFAPAFFNMLKTRRPMILIFSGADRLYWEFEEKFVNKNKTALMEYNDLYDVNIINNANHIFSFPEWQSEMLSHAEKWLEKNYL